MTIVSNSSYNERMRIIFTLLLFAFLVPAPHAQAGDVFIKKHKSEEEAVQEDMEDALGLKDESEETPPEQLGRKELANQYFHSCMTKEDPVMSKFSQEMLCGCTAAKMQETMLLDDIRAMFTNTKEGAFQRSRVMAFIYVPCMEYPVHDLIYNDCRGNEQIRGSLKNYDRVCKCLAENMSVYITENGTKILGGTNRNGIPNPEALVQNTLADFMSSESYEIKAQYYTTTCVQKHEFGW